MINIGNKQLMLDCLSAIIITNICMPYCMQICSLKFGSYFFFLNFPFYRMIWWLVAFSQEIVILKAAFIP